MANARRFGIVARPRTLTHTLKEARYGERVASEDYVRDSVFVSPFGIRCRPRMSLCLKPPRFCRPDRPFHPLGRFPDLPAQAFPSLNGRGLLGKGRQGLR